MQSLFIAFGAVALWSTLALTIRLLTTVKKRSGMYFYAILVTTWGLSLRQIANFIQFYAPSCPWQLGFTLQQAGWVGMITGFSMVLYSRLSIILMNYKARRSVLGMILLNGIVWHTAMIIILGGMRAAQNSNHPTGESARSCTDCARVITNLDRTSSRSCCLEICS